MSESKKKNPRKYRDKIELLQLANDATNKEFEDAMRDRDNNIAVEDANRLGPVRHKSGDNRASPYDIQRSRSLSPRPSKNKTVYLKPRDLLEPPVSASHLTRQKSDPYLSKSAGSQEVAPQMPQAYNTLRPNAPVVNNSNFVYQSSSNYFAPITTIPQPGICQPPALSQNYQTHCNGFGNDNQLYLPVNTEPSLINSSSQSSIDSNSIYYSSDSNQNFSYSTNLDLSGRNVQYTQLQNTSLQPSSLPNSVPDGTYVAGAVTNILHQPTTTIQTGNLEKSDYVSNILQPGATNSQEAASPIITQPVTSSYQSWSVQQTTNSGGQSNILLYPRDNNTITTIDHSAIAPVSNSINTLGDEFINKNTYTNNLNNYDDKNIMASNILSHISTSYVVTSQPHHQSPSRRHTTANLCAMPGGGMAPLQHQQRRHSDNIPTITITNADGEHQNSFSVHRHHIRTDSVSDHDDDLSRDSLPGSPAGSFVGQEEDSHTLGMGNDLKNILDLDKLYTDTISKFE